MLLKLILLLIVWEWIEELHKQIENIFVYNNSKNEIDNFKQSQFPRNGRKKGTCWKSLTV